MSVPQQLFFRFFYVIVLFFFVIAAPAQYTAKRPSFSSREVSSISVEAIRYYPDHMWIDLNFQDNLNTNPGYRIDKETAIVFPWMKNVTVRQDDIKNVDYTTYKYVKKGSKHTFSVRFPLNIAELFGKKNTIIRENMARSFPLTLDLVECKKSYKKPSAADGCFNIYGVQLGLSYDQLTVLYCQGILLDYLKKDEFETTANFQRRTHPDSVRAMIMTQIHDLESIYISNVLLSIYRTVPTINYDSDKELFTIQYNGVKAFRIKVPLDKARAFKESVLDRRLVVVNLSGYRESDVFSVATISFKDAAGKTTSYDNIDVPDDRIQSEAEQKMYEELKRVFPVKGKLP